MSITELIEEAEHLNAEAAPAPWTVENAEQDCGSPCTPNGCFGHDTGVAEQVEGPQLTITCRGDVFEQLGDEDGFHIGTWNADMCFIARSRTLLPLLVTAIKNQQRQIEELTEFMDSMHWDYPNLVRDTRANLSKLAAELEDVKPC